MAVASETAKEPTVLSRRKLLCIAGMGWTFDAMDVGLLAFLLTALKEDWGLTAAQLGWIGSINSIGMAVGAFVFGIMADRKGRKPVFILTLLLFSLGCGLTALASSLMVVLILRFFIGMG
ncbi:MFS transporter, partial [Staphylococcus aureus]